jgi:hypothetical protein
MPTREEHIIELESINEKLADIWAARKDATYHYRTMKADFQILEAEVLNDLNSGEIPMASKPTEKDKLNLTIERAQTKHDKLWSRMNEQKAIMEGHDSSYQLLDTRRSVIQTILNKREQ